MRLRELPEDLREPVRKLRRRLCEDTLQNAGVRPEACQSCQSPCQYGRQLLRMLGMPAEAEPARISDVFEPMTHARGRRTRKVIMQVNKSKWRMHNGYTVCVCL